jgi:hypothetical protein
MGQEPRDEGTRGEGGQEARPLDCPTRRGGEASTGLPGDLFRLPYQEGGGR